LAGAFFAEALLAELVFFDAAMCAPRGRLSAGLYRDRRPNSSPISRPQ